MAKATTRRPAKPTRKAGTAKPKKKAAGSRAAGAAKPKGKSKAEPNTSAAEALAGLLETPLVAEVIAAGAAAALSTLTQHALSKKADGGTAAALKQAAKAAAGAMGTRLAAEFDEIVKSAKESKESRRGSG